MPIFQRNCPKCGNLLSYKSLKNKERANLHGSLCRSCTWAGRYVATGMVGKVFGKLFVKEMTDRRDSNGNCYWLCECACRSGIPVFACTADLRSGGIGSCGCSRKDFSRAYPHPKMRLRPFESLYNHLKNSRARYAEIPVHLTYEEFLEFTNIRECHYCGDPVYWTEYNLNGKSCATNLDRKDNNLGYSKSNCVVCCLPCNRTKSNRFAYEEFVIMMRALRDYRRQQKTVGAF